MLTIYHNPRCRKSRETLQLLQDRGHTPTVVEYLQTPPAADLLAKAYSQFGAAFLRKGEDEFKAHFKDQDLEAEQVADLLRTYPKVMERPLVVNETTGQMALGRPPEAVLEIV